MTEQKDHTKPPKPLTLSTTTRTSAAPAKGASDATQVRQKFSHGRTRVVEVEVRQTVKRPAGANADAPYPQAGRRCGGDDAHHAGASVGWRCSPRRRRRAEDADRGREGS